MGGLHARETIRVERVVAKGGGVEHDVAQDGFDSRVSREGGSPVFEGGERRRHRGGGGDGNIAGQAFRSRGDRRVGTDRRGAAHLRGRGRHTFAAFKNTAARRPRRTNLGPGPGRVPNAARDARRDGLPRQRRGHRQHAHPRRRVAARDGEGRGDKVRDNVGFAVLWEQWEQKLGGVLGLDSDSDAEQAGGGGGRRGRGVTPGFRLYDGLTRADGDDDKENRYDDRYDAKTPKVFVASPVAAALASLPPFVGDRYDDRYDGDVDRRARVVAALGDASNGDAAVNAAANATPLGDKSLLRATSQSSLAISRAASGGTRSTTTTVTTTVTTRVRGDTAGAEEETREMELFAALEKLVANH